MTAWALVLVGMAANLSAAEKPNILVIMSDDMGYSDIGCMGGEIQTPNLDALAADGARFTQFYNTARCCPTRASLLTGLHPHAAGQGHMKDNTDLPGYTGSINNRCVTIAEVLKPAGYRTYAVGKWHVTHPYGPKGPFTHYPLQRGFDKFYGTITGAGSYYDPTTLCRGNTFITPENDPDYQPKSFYYTDAITDNAIRFLQQHRTEPGDQPFFMYLAYTAAHWPMHAKPEDIAKYKGKYDVGYDAIRKKREAKMRQLGLLDPKWKATPTVGNFDEIKDKKWEARCMEVYAAMVDCMDQGVGRIVAELKASGQLDNTLILYLQDNGACAETLGREKRPIPKVLKPRDKNWLQPKIWPPMQTRDGRPVLTGPSVMAGPDDTYLSYGEAWANVSNTPYRKYKHWVHEGGISTPLIAHWPAGMKGTTKGRLISELGQLPDILATCVDLAGAAYPKTFKGNEIVPMAGKSLKPMLVSDNGKLEERILFWEHEGNRAVRAGNWKLVAKGPDAAWELYDMSKDRTELNDLAGKHPDRVKTMVAAWENWAYANNVLPWPWKPAYASTQPKRLSENVSAARPNLVFIIADDCTFRDIGCYGGQAHTPNIDRLATEGMKFNRCFQAAPMCSPTRHNIYTGLYPVKSGAYPNHTFAKPGTKSIIHYLKPLGYRVALSGKTHIAPKEVFPFEYSGNKNPDTEAIDRLFGQCKESATPFCLFACSNEPHTPWNKGDPSAYPPEKNKLPPYIADTPFVREQFSKYLAEITYFDGQVGQILDLLDKHGLREDTLVMVVSEQGNSLPFAKWTCHEMGLGSAMIVRWPGKVKAGSKTDALVEYCDIAPTFVEVAGGKPAAGLDGKSFLQVLLGATNHHKDVTYGIMTTRGIINGNKCYPIRSIRDNQYRLIWNLNSQKTFRNACTKSKAFQSMLEAAAAGNKRAIWVTENYQNRPEFELYDVLADPMEMNNLAGDAKYAKTIEKLKAKLEAWMAEQGDLGIETELDALNHQKKAHRHHGEKKSGKRREKKAS